MHSIYFSNPRKNFAKEGYYLPLENWLTAHEEVEGECMP